MCPACMDELCSGHSVDLTDAERDVFYARLTARAVETGYTLVPGDAEMFGTVWTVCPTCGGDTQDLCEAFSIPLTDDEIAHIAAGGK